MPAGSLPYFNRFHIKPILYYFKTPKLSSVNLFLEPLLLFSPQEPEDTHFVLLFVLWGGSQLGQFSEHTVMNLQDRE